MENDHSVQSFVSLLRRSLVLPTGSPSWAPDSNRDFTSTTGPSVSGGGRQWAASVFGFSSLLHSCCASVCVCVNVRASAPGPFPEVLWILRIAATPTGCFSLPRYWRELRPLIIQVGQRWQQCSCSLTHSLIDSQALDDPNRGATLECDDEKLIGD